MARLGAGDPKSLGVPVVSGWRTVPKTSLGVLSQPSRTHGLELVFSVSCLMIWQYTSSRSASCSAHS